MWYVVVSSWSLGQGLDWGRGLARGNGVEGDNFGDAKGKIFFIVTKMRKNYIIETINIFKLSFNKVN